MCGTNVPTTVLFFTEENRIQEETHNTWRLNTEPKARCGLPGARSSLKSSKPHSLFRKQNQTTFFAPCWPLPRAAAVLGRRPERHPVIPRHSVYICLHVSSYLQPPFMPPVRGGATMTLSGWAGNRVPRDIVRLKSLNLWRGWHLDKQGNSWGHHRNGAGGARRRRTRRRVLPRLLHSVAPFL